MPFLIDGHNLIGQMPGQRLADPDDEQHLIEQLRAYLVRVGKKGVVIFDKGLPGGAGKWSNNVLEVRFAPAPKTADDVITDRLRRDRNPRGLIVVSADHALIEAAQRAGAAVRSPARFLADMAGAAKSETPNPKEVGLSADEVADWERAFRAGKPRDRS
ncbi:MAG: NYN domain-containing protein [Anaerolineales bacterium]|nr:NYN domain-containing protein [Anaerolineales bacterium]